MQLQPTREAEPPTIQPLEFTVGSYKVRCSLDCRAIYFSACSDISQLFGVVYGNSISEHERHHFGSLWAIYSMLEECRHDPCNMRLSDASEL